MHPGPRKGFNPPSECSLPILAIHRGDARQLAECLERDPGLITRRFPDMPYGNIELRGATLLHCAVEFGEIECLDVLFNKHADINVTAAVIDGIGGQTPLFHAINTNGDDNFYTLQYLAKRVGPWIDLSVRATWRSYGAVQAVPMTAFEYAEHAAQTEDPKWRKKTTEELALVRSLDLKTQLKQAIRREEIAMVKRLLDTHPGLLEIDLWPPAIYEARSLAITRLLLERGLNPNECSAPRKPLHLAVYQCLPDIVDPLITHGADVNQRNPLGETPLDLLLRGDSDIPMPKSSGCCENTHAVRDDGTALLTELVELLPGRDAFAAKPGTQSRELKLGTLLAVVARRRSRFTSWNGGSSSQG